MKLVRGSELVLAVQKQALARFVHRYTGDHTPQWAIGDSRYVVQFRDDQEWLANTLFPVTNDGRLDKRYHFCESRPTWPEGRNK